jgi:hypothetical protein
MMSCPERAEILEQTLADLRMSDWDGEVKVQIDQSLHTTRGQSRVEDNAHSLLRRATEEKTPFLLFLEDDLHFNRYLRHNLEHWSPIRAASPDEHFFGSLYNPSIQPRWADSDAAYFVAEPEAVYGSQAVLLSRATIEYVLAHWSEVAGMPDIKMSRLAARSCALHFHLPSLVQHVGAVSVWGGVSHTAIDFQRDWKA